MNGDAFTVGILRELTEVIDDIAMVDVIHQADKRV
jgi:hypothetical protein